MPLEAHYERQTTPLYRLSPREAERYAHAARFDDPRSRTIVAACEAQGIPTTGKPGGANPSDAIQWSISSGPRMRELLPPKTAAA